MYDNSSKLAGAARTRDSLASEADRLLQRLRDIYGRTEQMGNRIVGSEPRPADAQASPPLDSLARAINEAHMIVTMIDNELQRIDARL